MNATEEFVRVHFETNGEPSIAPLDPDRVTQIAEFLFESYEDERLAAERHSRERFVG